MAKLLVSLTGPDGRTVLAEPGGQTYTRLLSRGFVDPSRVEPKPTIAETAREIVAPPVEMVAGMSEPESDTETETQSFDISTFGGTISAVEVRTGKRGRKPRPKAEYVKIEE